VTALHEQDGITKVELVAPRVLVARLLQVTLRPVDVSQGRVRSRLVWGELLRLLDVLERLRKVARLAEHERALERYVGRLEGLLPICAFCKSIRNEAGRWEPLESYIETHSHAEFSHGFCPACAHQHYPRLRKRSAVAAD
jgi:hypothetical protein